MGWETLVICKFSNKCTCTRKKEVEGLSCGFEDKHLHPINFEHAYVAELSDFIGIQQFHAACAFVEVISEGDAAGPVLDFPTACPQAEVNRFGGLQHLLEGGDVYG